MRLLVTGGTGVLGQALSPLTRAAGHESPAPTRDELDLFDPVAVAHATPSVDAVSHLASRIQPLEQLDNPEAWRKNDQLAGTQPVTRSMIIPPSPPRSVRSSP